MKPVMPTRPRPAKKTKKTGLVLLITLVVIILSILAIPALIVHAGPLLQATLIPTVDLPFPVVRPPLQPTAEPLQEPTPAEPPDRTTGPVMQFPTPEQPAPTATSDQDAISAAVFERIASLQETSLAYLLYEVKIDTIKLSKDGSQAVVWMAFYDRDSGQLIASEPAMALATRSEEGWQVTLQVEAEWDARLETAPETLISPEMKVQLAQPRGEVMAEAGVVYSGYKLPWAGGSYNRVSGSIGHVLTYKSCPSTCMYAFDFADGTMFPIHAARAGRVKYAQWIYANGNTTNTNYLVLEDASTVPTTYQVYYHLAKDSIPAALRKPGALVNQGQYLGLADDTGASTGHHLHFHVHTTANAVWGSSVDIRFSDVPVNGGRPRTCTEASAYPQYGAECTTGNRLLSGNKTGPLPAAPVATAPKGTVYTNAPVLEWNAVTGGLQYYLMINKSGSTSYIATQLVNASAVCKEGKCSIPLAAPLADGAYGFRLRVGGATGWSANSPVLAFTIKTTLQTPALVAPFDTIYVNNPAYTWTPVPGADRYYLIVYSVKSSTNIIYRTLMAADVCPTGAQTCAYTSTARLTHGDYTYKVRAGTAFGWGAYSPTMTFRAYLAPLPPTLVSPLPDVKERAQRPLYRWTASPGATKYYLQIYSVGQAAVIGNYSADSVYLCGSENCSWRVALSLTAGKYRFRVRASNGLVWGDYSPYQDFTVQLVPDAPVLLYPTGTIAAASPAYTWSVVPGATSYYLMVWSNAESKYIIYRTLAAGTYCGADTCAYTSTANVLSGRSYKYKVRAYNSFGWGAYSPETTFNVAY